LDDLIILDIDYQSLNSNTPKKKKKTYNEQVNRWLLTGYLATYPDALPTSMTQIVLITYLAFNFIDIDNLCGPWRGGGKKN